MLNFPRVLRSIDHLIPWMVQESDHQRCCLVNVQSIRIKQSPFMHRPRKGHISEDIQDKSGRLRAHHTDRSHCIDGGCLYLGVEMAHGLNQGGNRRLEARYPERIADCNPIGDAPPSARLSPEKAACSGLSVDPRLPIAAWRTPAEILVSYT